MYNQKGLTKTYRQWAGSGLRQAVRDVQTEPAPSQPLDLMSSQFGSKSSQYALPTSDHFLGQPALKNANNPADLFANVNRLPDGQGHNAASSQCSVQHRDHSLDGNVNPWRKDNASQAGSTTLTAPQMG